MWWYILFIFLNFSINDTIYEGPDYEFSTWKFENIDYYPILNIEDLIQYSPSSVKIYENYIRGSDYYQNIYYINGFPVYNPYTGESKPFIPLISIKKIKIKRGNFDIENQDANSGLFFIETKKPEDKLNMEIRISDRDINFLDEEKGDYYADLLLGRKSDLKREKIYEFLLSGPLFKYKNIKFLLSSEYTDFKHSNFPRNYSFFSKIDFEFNKIKLNIQGAYKFRKNKLWDANWRLALDNYFKYQDKTKFLSSEINFDFKDFKNKIKLGYFSCEYKRDVLEDVDNDGVDDFDDRDEDGFVEVDIDYFRPVYYNSSQGKWIVEDYRKGIDSLMKLYNGNTKYLEINEKGGYVELPFYWWEAGAANLYPSTSMGPAWWAIDTTYSSPYNRAGWGARVRFDIELIQVRDTVSGKIDTVIYMSNKWYKYPFIPSSEYIRNGKGSLSDLLGPDWIKDTTLLRVGNQYMPLPWVYPREQFSIKKSSYFYFSYNINKIFKNHRITSGFNFKKPNFYEYTIDYAGGLSNIYFNLTNIDFIKRENDTSYTIIDFLKEHKIEPWEFNFYLGDNFYFKNLKGFFGSKFYVFNTSQYLSDSIILSQPDSIGIRYVKNLKKSGPLYFLNFFLKFKTKITEKTEIGFNYSNMLQFGYYYPIVNLVFSGVFLISGVGTSPLKPLRSILYEINLLQNLEENLHFLLSLFYKENIAITTLSMQSTSDYISIVENKGYHYSYGYEFILRKNRGGEYFPNVGFYFILTYQKAYGNSLYPEMFYRWQWSRFPLPENLFPLNWDSRYKFIFNFEIYMPQNLPFLFRNSGISFFLFSRTGTPWTPPFRNSRDAMEKINTKRLPPVDFFSLIIFKEFKISDYGTLGIFLDVYNLFNNENLLTIADPTWYQMFNDPEGKAKDIRVRGERRNARLGFYLKIKGF